MNDDQRCFDARTDVLTFQTAPLTANVTVGGPITAHLAGYQALVRGEILRGRYRTSFSKPEPFVSGQVTAVGVQLPDVLHTFRAGHRIMVQVQSAWFPMFDRNPQTFTPNIYQAPASAFVRATQRVWVSREAPSSIVTYLYAR